MMKRRIQKRRIKNSWVKNNWKLLCCRMFVLTLTFTAVAGFTEQSYAGPADEISQVITVKNPMQGPGIFTIADTAENAVLEENYLGGARLWLLKSEDGGQNLSSVICTKNGKVIVIDGGRETDAVHLTEVIQSLGGRVDTWLITHPHNDHIGALTNILQTNPIPVEIDRICYSFLENSYYEQGENQGRMSDLTNLQEAFEKLDPTKFYAPVKQGTQLQVDDVQITVMNDPFACPQNTFNNSSVAYRLELGGKRVLFLGDMGWQAGKNLLRVCSAEELNADVVQMSHHGQDGVEKEVYAAISPEVCLWPTPQWLWDNEKNGVAGAGSFKTLTVRGWMKELGAKVHLSIKDGDQLLQ